MLLQTALAVFLWLSSITLCVCVYTHTHHTSLCIHLLMDIQVISMFGYCKIVPLWTQGCMCAFELRVLFGYMPRSGTAGSYGNSIFLYVFNFFFFFFYFWPCHMAYEILVPWPGIEPRPLVVKAQNPNHWCVCVRAYACTHTRIGRVQLFVTPWTVTCQAPLSTELFRQEY